MKSIPTVDRGELFGRAAASLATAGIWLLAPFILAATAAVLAAGLASIAFLDLRKSRESPFASEGPVV